jgi:hypothetical protein
MNLGLFLCNYRFRAPGTEECAIKVHAAYKSILFSIWKKWRDDTNFLFYWYNEYGIKLYYGFAQELNKF